MVAGASRILAALDGVPAGVVPKCTGTRRAQPRRTAWFRRPGVGIAAAMAVVAVGTTWAVTRDWDQAAFQRAEQASEITLRAPVSEPARAPSPAAPVPVVVTADSATADPRQSEGVAPSRTRLAAGSAANAESAQSIVVQESSGVQAPRAADVSRLLAERQEQAMLVVPSESSVEAAKAVQNDAAARGQVGAVDSAARVEMPRQRVLRPSTEARARGMAPAAPPIVSGRGLTETAAALAGCYALELGQTGDGTHPELPTVVRLAETIADAAADVTPPPAQGFRMAARPLLVPPAVDSGQLGWRLARSDSVSVLLSAEGRAVHLTFPSDAVRPQVGLVRSEALPGIPSWSAPVTVQRVPCVPR
jgi:hypothetical protein